MLNIRFNGALEVQQLTVEDNSEEEEVIKQFPFNTIEFGPEISLDFPTFLLPFAAEKFSKNNNPKTSVTAAFNFQQRPDYTRKLNQHVLFIFLV